MKKFLTICAIITCGLIITGCGKNNEGSVLKKLTKKIEGADTYSLKGELEIMNNEDSYIYNVDVLYGKKDNFRVSLKNQSNNHEQIILKNSEGVYV